MTHEITSTLIRALSDVEDADPDDLDYSLHEFIDPDVVDAMANRGESNWHLQFAVKEHTVTIDCSGLLTVDGVEYRWDSDDSAPIDPWRTA